MELISHLKNLFATMIFTLSSIQSIAKLKRWEEMLQILTKLESREYLGTSSKCDKTSTYSYVCFVFLNLVIFCTDTSMLFTLYKEYWKIIFYIDEYFTFYYCNTLMFIISNLVLIIKYKLEDINSLIEMAFKDLSSRDDVTVVITAKRSYFRVTQVIEIFNDLCGKQIVLLCFYFTALILKLLDLFGKYNIQVYGFSVQSNYYAIYLGIGAGVSFVSIN